MVALLASASREPFSRAHARVSETLLVFVRARHPTGHMHVARTCCVPARLRACVPARLVPACMHACLSVCLRDPALQRAGVAGYVHAGGQVDVRAGGLRAQVRTCACQSGCVHSCEHAERQVGSSAGCLSKPLFYEENRNKSTVWTLHRVRHLEREAVHVSSWVAPRCQRRLWLGVPQFRDAPAHGTASRGCAPRRFRISVRHSS